VLLLAGGELLRHGVDRRLGLLVADPRLEPAEELEPRHAAARGIRAGVEVAVQSERHPDRRPRTEHRAVEPARRDPDDGERPPADADRSSDHRRVAPEPRPPHLVADDRHRLRVRVLRARIEEEAAQRGHDPQDLEVVAGHVQPERDLGSGIGRHRDVAQMVRGEAAERARRALAVVQIRR
jgi:hypothetical protein